MLDFCPLDKWAVHVIGSVLATRRTCKVEWKILTSTNPLTYLDAPISVLMCQGLIKRYHVIQASILMAAGGRRRANVDMGQRVDHVYISYNYSMLLPHCMSYMPGRWILMNHCYFHHLLLRSSQSYPLIYFSHHLYKPMSLGLHTPSDILWMNPGIKSLTCILFSSIYVSDEVTMWSMDLHGVLNDNYFTKDTSPEKRLAFLHENLAGPKVSLPHQHWI